jgi:diguanylate cyclase (GGDEF)-like protein/PAS domain S-box-containing protein
MASTRLTDAARKDSNHRGVMRGLVVDDERLNRLVLMRILESEGVEALAASSGKEAIEIIERESIDLVLLDISMPEINGFAVLERIRRKADESSLAVIMVTASSDREHVLRSFDIGANDFVTKPIDAGVTLARVRTQLKLLSAQRALRESEQRYALAAKGANDGLWDWNLETGHVYFSSRWKTMVGLEPETQIASTDAFWSRIHPNDVKRAREEMDRHLSGESEHFEVELRVRHSRENYRWMLCRGMGVRNPKGNVVRIAGSLTDITEGKVADALTGLPNRLMFGEQVSRAFELYRCQKSHRFVDNFKSVNDNYGHEAGDRLLISLANRLLVATSPFDVVISRLGGDEFAILARGIKDTQQGETLASKILNEVTQPITISDTETFLPTISIGISLVSDRCAAADDLLREADMAMYQAKSHGKRCCRMYDPAMHERVKHRLNIEGELKQALKNDEFLLYYQPIVSLEDGSIESVEALIRWQHPTKTLMAPDAFLPIAQECGMGHEIGEWVLHQACRQLRQWSDLGIVNESFTIDVNISTEEAIRGRLVETVRKATDSTGVQPSRLRVELTESSIMEDTHAVVRTLQQLQALGVRVAVDDFGTGYSSLAYLHQFPLELIKIDRSFVKHMVIDSTSMVIDAIHGLAQGFGLRTVAEGIETSEQLRRIKACGCEYGQGYFFSQPAPPHEIEDKFAIGFPQLLDLDSTHLPKTTTS